MSNPSVCPECGRVLLDNGVMLIGNVLTMEPERPARRLECPDCLVMVAGEIEPAEGWRLWEAQGHKRPDERPPDQEVRVALSFELCDHADGMMMLGRPQDFRVKAARWQYAEFDMYQKYQGKVILYHTFVYSRRWLGEGIDLAELDHDDHPTKDDMLQLTRNLMNQLGGGLPIQHDQAEPMAYTDPLKEDDFLDDSDNPEDFEWGGDNNEDFDDRI